MKAQSEMLGGVKRGDRVVTGGGIIGLVTKVIADNELQVELAEGVRVRIIKADHHRHPDARRIGARRQGMGRGREAAAAAKRSRCAERKSLLAELFGGGRSKPRSP